MKRKTSRLPAALRGLSLAHRVKFRTMARAYGISDPGGIEVLVSGLVSLDEAVRCEAQIEADGRLQTDRFGQLKAHPLLPVARDARAAWQSALRGLTLDIGTPPKVGRPGGS